MNITSLYKKLLGDIFSYGFLDSLTRVTSFLLLPILTRVFSSSEYGVIDLVAALSSFLMSFTTLSLPGALARYYHNDQEKAEQNSILFSTLFLFHFVFSAFILAMIFIWSHEISVLLAGGKDYTLYIRLGATAAFFNGMGNLPQMFLRRRRKIRTFGSIKIITCVLYVGLTLILVLVYKVGLKGVFIAQVFAYFLGLMISIVVTHRYLKLALNRFEMRKSLKFSLPMFPSLFVTWANEQFNRFIIINMLNPSVLGIFGAAFRISSVIRIAAQVFRKAWMPFSMEIISEESRSRVIDEILKFYLTGFLLISLVFSMISPEIIYILLPEKYYTTYLLIPWLTGAFVIHNSGAIVNMGSIIRERTAINSIAAWIGFVVNVSLCLLLLKPYGIIGASIGLFVANTLAAAVLLWKTECLIEIRFNKFYIFMLLILYIGGSIGILIMTYLISDLYISFALRFVIVAGVILIIDRVLWKNSVRYITTKIIKGTGWMITKGKNQKN